MLNAPAAVSVRFSNDVQVTVPLLALFAITLSNVYVRPVPLIVSAFELPVAVVNPFHVPAMPVLWFAAPLSWNITALV